MEESGSSETLVPAYQIKQSHIITSHKLKVEQ
jgi:hypothetical protein